MSFSWALAATLLLGGNDARATVVERMTVADQVDEADLIFVGTMKQSETVVSKDGKFPFTFVTFEPRDVLKGHAPGLVTLRLAGGETTREVVEVAGMPSFELGESYLLFVKDNGLAGCPVLGWSQGKLRFVTDPESGRELLADARGAVLTGIAGAQWSRTHAPDHLAARLGSPAPSYGVVAVSEGVKVVEDRERVATKAIADAEEVLAALRALIEAKASGPGFQKGRAFRSADPTDVPEGMGGVVSAPKTTEN
jgi:hypothetical protein